MDIDRVSDAIGLAAGVGGVLLIAATWPRRRRRAARQQHPSAGAPFALGLAGASGPWLVTVRDGRPPVTIDILTHRPTGSTEEWTSEEIIDPVAVAPGETVQIASTVTQLSGAHDVVIGWTVQHPTGDVQGSRAMRVSEQPTVVVTPEPVEPGVGFTMAYGLIAAFLAFASMVIGLRLIDDSRFQNDEPALVVSADSSSSTSMPPVATTSAPAETTTPNPTTTTTPTTTATATAMATTSVPTTASTRTTTSSTTAPTSTSTTAATSSTTRITTAPPTTSTTSTSTTTTTTTVPFSEREVVIEARVENCRFGADCVIASFTLVGFTGSGEYVCEFDDGSRFAFSFFGSGVDDACSTAGVSPSITIEVDGVRSKTVTRESLDGN